MAVNQSKDELERLFYERELASPGVGDRVNVTNDPANPVPVTLNDRPLPPGRDTIGHVITVLEPRTLLAEPSTARTTDGAFGPFSVGDLSRVAFDVNVTTVAGVGSNLVFTVDRLGADDVWYPMFTSPNITAARKVSTSIGQGMTIAQSLATNIRITYVITGTTPSFTFSASLVGK